MADKTIKGLTVEIGGDTSKLGIAIDEADKKSRALSSELGKINNLLKFDEANPELLAQKQQVLADQITNTVNKLKMLREAEEQVQTQFERGEVSQEQVRALQREIIAAENKLGTYRTAAEQTAAQIENLGKASDESAEVNKTLAETVKGQRSALTDLKSQYIEAAAAKGTDSDEAKALADQITALSAELQENADKLSAAKNAADHLGKTVEPVVEKEKTLSETVKDQKKELSDLKEQYADVAAAQGKDSNEAQELAGHIASLSDELKDNETRLSEAQYQSDELNDSMDDLGDSTEDASDSAEEAGKDFSGLTDTLGVCAKAAAATVGAITVAAVKMAADVVDSFGELEQNLGGSEAVFNTLGDSIDQMQVHTQKADAVTGEMIETVTNLADVSEEAYRTMGVSQSDYLASLNKMGALFQGSGLDQQEALDLSANALQRAADVASVMGIDTTAALESVTAAAKGNFTMMDNLGVAMNATTLEAYALANGLIAEGEASVDVKKVADAQDKQTQATLNLQKAQITYNQAVEKYGANSANAEKALISMQKAQVSLDTATRKVDEAIQGADESTSSWWSNASNADKARVAMQMFMETTEQYDGNFAREATETISGSLGLLASSWDSLTAGLGNNEADIENLTQNVIDAMLAVIDNVLPVVQSIGTALPTAVATIVSGAQEILPELLPVVADTLSEIITALVDAVPAITSELLSLILQLAPTMVSAVLSLLTNLLGTVMDMAPEILRELMQLTVDILSSLSAVLPGLISQLVSELIPALITNFFAYLPDVVEALMQLVTAIGDAIPDMIERLTVQLPTIVNTIVTALTRAVPTIMRAGIQLLGALLDAVPVLIQGLTEALPEIIGTIIAVLPELIDGIIGALLEMLPLLVDCGITLLVSLVNALPEIITQICAVLPQLIGGIVTALIGMLPQLIQCGITLLVSLVQALPTIIQAICAALPQIISAVIGALYSMIPLLVDCGIQLFLALIENMPEIVSSIMAVMPEIIDGIIRALYAMLPELIECGFTLFVSLIQNLGAAITKIVSAVPQIVTSIKNGFVNQFSVIRDVGRNLIEGLWNGIQDMASWIHNKITGFGEGILNSLKDFFGIASPSRVFREQIGKNLALGLAAGIEEEADVAVDAAQQMADDISDIEFQPHKLDFSAIGGTTAEENPFVFERNLQTQWNANLPNQQVTFIDPAIITRLDNILGAIERGQVLVLDGDAVVGGTIDRIDKALGDIEIMSKRR